MNLKFKCNCGAEETSDSQEALDAILNGGHREHGGFSLGPGPSISFKELLIGAFYLALVDCQ